MVDMLIFSARGCALVATLILSALTVGCAHQRSNCVPPELLQSEQIVDLNAAPGAHAPVNRQVFDVLTADLRKQADGAPNGSDGRRLNVLALSGGGSNGAFTAGVLAGWSATGKRPAFDIVTGISSGALIATFAFLGPEYDDEVGHLYTSVSAPDIYRRRPELAVLWSDSAASSAPLKRQIDSQINRCVLAAVAAAYAQGRQIYIGTTNLDTGRLVIWDMGAIAASGRPEALQLYRDVVLASASVPGFFPPVPIEVTVNGQQYTEKHVDGATTSQLFVRASMLNLDPATIRPDRRPLVGSHLYVIVAGKLFPDPRCAAPRALSIGENALSALTSASTRNDLVRTYTLSLLTGMSFHVAAIPQDFPTNKSSMAFDQEEMRRLYAQGYQLAAAEQMWRDTPPVVAPSEQSVPRAGTQFVTGQVVSPDVLVPGTHRDMNAGCLQRCQDRSCCVYR